jgi:hypothetical protein
MIQNVTCNNSKNQNYSIVGNLGDRYILQMNDVNYLTKNLMKADVLLQRGVKTRLDIGELIAIHY